MQQMQVVDVWRSERLPQTVYIHAQNNGVAAFLEERPGMDMDTAVSRLMNPPVSETGRIQIERPKPIFPGYLKWDPSGKVIAIQLNDPYVGSGLSLHLIRAGLMHQPSLRPDTDLSPDGARLVRRINRMHHTNFSEVATRNA